MSDTIFAQATAPGRAGVAVIRISGPAAYDAAVRLTGTDICARHASLRSLRDPETGEVVDEALVLHFPEPASYTGESVVEFQCHGSPAVTRRILAILAALPDLRLARPGEFSRRALENGRLDLVQIEGLADLLAAETEAQRRQAHAVASGILSTKMNELRGELLEVLALVEAVIDFGEDVPASVLDPVARRIDRVSTTISTLLAGSAASERLRDGYVVALCGEPNVGKSTLLNAIAGRPVALTSDVAGTTRDVLEVHLDLNGLPVTFLDTAGIRESQDPVERLGVERARIRAEAADLRVFLRSDDSAACEKQYHEEDLIVQAKSDLKPGHRSTGVSGLTGQGIDSLLQRIADILQERASTASGVANDRQRGGLARALESLQHARSLQRRVEPEIELIAFELREAIRLLDHVTGKIDTEAVLDTIFRSFCLGK